MTIKLQIQVAEGDGEVSLRSSAMCQMRVAPVVNRTRQDLRPMSSTTEVNNMVATDDTFNSSDGRVVDASASDTESGRTNNFKTGRHSFPA